MRTTPARNCICRMSRRMSATVGSVDKLTAGVVLERPL